MLYFDNYVPCNINSDDVYKIVSQCFVKIENIANRSSPFPQKYRTLTQSEMTLPASQQACGEKVGVSNYKAYNSGNLPHIPKLTTSSHDHPFGIRNPKIHCFVNVILQIINSVFRTTHQKMYFNNCVEGKIPECFFDTRIKHLVHKKWKH